MMINVPAAFGLAIVTALTADAATATANINVRLDILSECLINAVPDIDFGASGVLAANVDATTTLSVQCTTGTPYTVALSAGAGIGATIGARRMTGPASQTVTYGLYRDPGHTQLWGVSIGVDTAAGTGNGAAQTLTVYGRVPPQTTPGPGTYTDVVVATVTY
ncbi:MAG: spore coat U domain-containing protein [Micropepsaceae bacterium]